MTDYHMNLDGPPAETRCARCYVKTDIDKVDHKRLCPHCSHTMREIEKHERVLFIVPVVITAVLASVLTYAIVS